MEYSKKVKNVVLLTAEFGAVQQAVHQVVDGKYARMLA
jgi:hypothetical protein